MHSIAVTHLLESIFKYLKSTHRKNFMQISLEPYLSDEQCSTHLKSSERSLHTKHPLAVSSTQSPMHKSWHCFLSVVNEGDCSKRWHVFLFQQYPVFGHFLHSSSQLVIFFPITIFPNWIILSQSIWWWWWWWCSEQIKLICGTNKFFVSRPRSQLSGFKKNLSLIKLLLWCRDGEEWNYLPSEDKVCHYHHQF